MDITPLVERGTKLIKSYGDKSFKIGDEEFSSSIIITSNSIIEDDIQNIDQLTLEKFISIIKKIDTNSTELIMIGTGENHVNPIKEIQIYCIENKINIEFMQTGAACRTFNILTAEDRSVSAILILV